MYNNWTTPENEERLREAAANSFSLRAMAQHLGLTPAGGSNETMKHHIARLNLDISHFTGQGWNKENYKGLDVVKSKTGIRSNLLQERGHQCESCKLKEWMGSPIPLEVEHVDGDRYNNSGDNLKILCPNCHAQTPTWRRKK